MNMNIVRASVAVAISIGISVAPVIANAQTLDIYAGNGLTWNYQTNKFQVAPPTLAQITGAEQTTNKGLANGYQGLNASGKIPLTSLDSTGASNGYVLTWNGTNLVYAAPTGGSGGGTGLVIGTNSGNARDAALAIQQENLGISTATTAQTTANGAQSTAQTASTTASNALTSANSAASTAQQAQSTATNAGAAVTTETSRATAKENTLAPLANPVFTTVANGVSPQTADNSTALATTNWVRNQNYGSSSGGSYTLPQATSVTLGGVTISTGITVNAGAISVAYGTSAGTAAVGNDSRFAAAASAVQPAGLASAIAAALPAINAGHMIGGTGFAGQTSDITIGGGLQLVGNTLSSTVTSNPGTVTSVALSLPSIFSVSGTPITSTGTLSASLNSQGAATVFAAPNGASGTPTFRTLSTADITGAAGLNSPAFTGVPTVPTAALGTNTTQAASTAFVLANGVASVNGLSGAISSLQLTASINQFSPTLPGAAPASGGGTLAYLRADGSWAIPPGTNTATGTVTSVGLTLPSFYTVSGTPVTSSGNLTAVLNSQASATVLAAPAGAAGVPSFRNLGVADISGAAALASPTFTGIPSVPTATPGTNTTQAASTAFVIANQGVASINGLTGALTSAQVTAALNSATTTLPGLAPPRSGTATTYLDGSGNYSTPAGTGGGTVNSVGLALPSSLFNVTNSPVTNSGTLTGVLASQSAATVFAAPAGAAGLPTFRGLTNADVSGSAGLASPTFTGTPSVPTAAVGTNTTQAASTAFVLANGVNSVAGLSGTVTAAQITAALNNFSSSLPGTVPASGGGTANFMRADGTWAAPVSGNVNYSNFPTQPTNSLIANISGASGTPVSVSPSALLDNAYGTTANTVFYRNSAGNWVEATMPTLFDGLFGSSLGGMPVRTSGGWVDQLPGGGGTVWVSGGTGVAPTWRQLTNADVSGSAGLVSPAFTGTPTAPTAAVGTNSTQVATTAFVLANAGSGGGSSVPNAPRIITTGTSATLGATDTTVLMNLTSAAAFNFTCSGTTFVDGQTYDIIDSTGSSGSAAAYPITFTGCTIYGPKQAITTNAGSISMKWSAARASFFVKG